MSRWKGRTGLFVVLVLVSCTFSVILVEVCRERALGWMVYVELLWLWAVTEIEKP